MRRLLNLIMALTIGSLAVLPAVAATPPQPTAGQALEISPPVIELTADPGQTVTANIRIRDVSPTNLLVKGRADDFAAQGENGDPKILLDETETTRFSLKQWIESVPNLNLVPKEIKTATIKINIPKNAEPGGHYGVVRFTGQPPELEGTGVALSASIGALILLRVNGPLVEKASLAEFYASKRDKNGIDHKAILFEYGPLQLIERIKNEGTIHIKPTGTVDVYGTFGRKVASLPVNAPPRNVLPDSIRRFNETLNKHWLFGRYTAKMKLSYGSAGTVASTLVFWVIPWKLILLLLLGLVILVWLLRVGLRRYNRYIISKSRRR